jgi:hypothetical protein
MRFSKGVPQAKRVTLAVGANGRIRVYNGSARPVHVRLAARAWLG